MSTELEIENEIQEKGLNAPRLTPDMIDSVIVNEVYETYSGTTLTVCVLFLKNGFTTVGHSSAVSLENFDAEIGRKIAKDNARNEIWKLEGYLLKEKLFQERRKNPLMRELKKDIEAAIQEAGEK